MSLNELITLLEAEIHCGQDKMDSEISHVCAGDLMSDILMFSQPHALLLTGLVNIQVVRTAEMLDIAAVVFIRGKKPSEEMLELARRKGIPLLTTNKTMYLSCGLLYEAGLKDIPLPAVKTELK